MVYIGARSYEAEKEKALYEAEQSVLKYKANQLSAEALQKQLQETMTKFNSDLPGVGVPIEIIRRPGYEETLYEATGAKTKSYGSTTYQPARDISKQKYEQLLREQKVSTQDIQTEMKKYEGQAFVHIPQQQHIEADTTIVGTDQPVKPENIKYYKTLTGQRVYKVSKEQPENLPEGMREEVSKGVYDMPQSAFEKVQEVRNVAEEFGQKVYSHLIGEQYSKVPYNVPMAELSAREQQLVMENEGLYYTPEAYARTGTGYRPIPESVVNPALLKREFELTPEERNARNDLILFQATPESVLISKSLYTTNETGGKYELENKSISESENIPNIVLPSAETEYIGLMYGKELSENDRQVGIYSNIGRRSLLSLDVLRASRVPYQANNFLGRMQENYDKEFNQAILKFQNKRNEELTLKTALLVGAGYAEVRFLNALTTPFFHPVETIKALPQPFIHPIKTFLQVKQEFKTDWLGTTANLAGTLAFFEVVGGVGKFGLTKAENVYVSLGAKKIPKESVFAEEVLAGEKNLPTAKTTAEVLSKFRGAVEETGLKFTFTERYGSKVTEEIFDLRYSNLKEGDVLIFNKPEGIIGVTAGTSKLKSTIAEAGRKGEVGLEDAGIYLFPRGEQSPYFLGLGDVPVEYSLNPLRMFENLGIPTLTEFRAKRIRTLPRFVTREAGFEPIIKYFKEGANKEEMIFITKRSQIGRGDIPRQKFEISQDFNLPMKALTVKRKGKFLNLKKGQLVKKGDIIIEAGTVEAEAIVPFETEFIYENKNLRGFNKFKGYEEFVNVEGTNVPIRKASILTEETKTQLLREGKAKIVEGKFEVNKESGLKIGKAEEISETKSIVETPYPSISRGLISISNIPISEDILRISESTISSRASKLISGSYISRLSSSLSREYSQLSENISRAISLSSSKSSLSQEYSEISKLSSKISKLPYKVSIPRRGYSRGGSEITSERTISDTSYTSLPSEISKRELRGQGFNTFVRDKGVKRKIGHRNSWLKGGFKQITKESLPFKKAHNLGREIIDNSPAATYEVLPSKKPTKISKDDIIIIKSEKFYKKGNEFIEKPKFRIDSKGEKEGITLKGIIANKRKNVLKKFKRFI